MSDCGERAIEAAEAAVALGTAHTIANISAGLATLGSDECTDCGDGIPAARRKALPSARRCVGCQSQIEREARGL